MGRRRKQTDLEDKIRDDEHEERRRNSELTEDERRALLYEHKRDYATALEHKKAADAALKNVCKRARAELGKDAVADIKDLIALDSPEGEAALKAEIERKIRIAKWAGAPMGTQFSFDADLTPAVERAYDLGKIAGLSGGVCKPPHDPSVPQYQQWFNGWQDGQAVLASGFKKKLEPIDVEAEHKPADTSDPPFQAPDMPEPPPVPH